MFRCGNCNFHGFEKGIALQLNIARLKNCRLQDVVRIFRLNFMNPAMNGVLLLAQAAEISQLFQIVRIRV